MVCLECENLSLGYGAHTVAKNISFTLNTGDYLCIVGENGAGKSTLVKTLLGLQKPLGGKIRAGEGFSLNSIGYLPQQTMVQKDFPATVQEVVRSGLLSRKGFFSFYTEKDRRRAAQVMEELGITALAKKSYRELSGGQQQRVLLARALCASENMLLLDEPVAGLDPVVTEELYSLIKKLNENGMTIIMVTHDIQAAIKYASHILYVGSEPLFNSRDVFLHSSPGKRFSFGTVVQEEIHD